MAESLDLGNFNVWAKKSFSEQAIAFLNAYWEEVEDQAEFIFTVAYKVMRIADMHFKGISFVHEYREGVDVDFVTGLYFYEKLNEFVEKPDQHGKVWRDDSKFDRSMPVKMTAVERKKTLSDHDFNSDNRISFLEYLLYQYSCDPNEFVDRSLENLKESSTPELQMARDALVEVNKKLMEYQKEKARLEKGAKEDGPSAKSCQFQLKALKSSPLASDLNAKLLSAEAKIRKATRDSKGGDTLSGTKWWLERDLRAKKELYGGRTNLAKKAPGVSKKKANAWIKKGPEKKWKVPS